MSVADCIKAVTLEIGKTRDLLDTEKKSLLKIGNFIDEQVNRLKENTDPLQRKDMIEDLKALIAEGAEELSNSKMTHLNTVLHVENFKSDVEKFRMADGKLDGDKAFKFIEDKIDSTTGTSIDSAQRTTQVILTSNYKNKVAKTGLANELTAGTFDKEIYVTMYDRSLEKAVELRDKRLEGLIEAFESTNDIAHQMTNRAGLKQNYLKSYLLKEGKYDNAKLMEMNIDDYAEMMFKEINLETSFKKTALLNKTDDEIKQIFREIYKEKTAPMNKSYYGEAVGQRSYRDMLKSREFQFKDGEAAWRVHEKIGMDGTLEQRFNAQIHSKATSIGAIQHLGVDPSETLGRMASHIKENSNATPARIRAEKATQAAYIDTISSIHSPVGMSEKLVNTARAVNTLKLGGAIFSAGYDVINSALQQSLVTGQPIISSFLESAMTFLKTLPGDVAENIAENLSITQHIDPLINMGMATSQTNNLLGQRGNKFFAGFSKLTGVPWQNVQSRATNAVMFANNFSKFLDGKLTGGNFEKLVLDRYGFTPDDINILRQMKRQDVGPAKIISTKDILNSELLDPEAAQKLFFKYSSYIDDMVHKGTPTSTNRTRRLTGMGRDQNDTTRIMSKMVMQFKETTFKILYDNAQAAKDFYNVQGAGTTAIRSAELAVISGITYMGIESLRALVSNKENPMQMWAAGKNKDVLFDFMTKAAFAPILADTIELGLKGRPGSVLNLLAGPTVGMAGDVGNIAAELAKGEGGKALDKARSLTQSTLPTSWFGVKAMEGYLLEAKTITGKQHKR